MVSRSIGIIFTLSGFIMQYLVRIYDVHINSLLPMHCTTRGYSLSDNAGSCLFFVSRVGFWITTEPLLSLTRAELFYYFNIYIVYLYSIYIWMLIVRNSEAFRYSITLVYLLLFFDDSAVTYLPGQPGQPGQEVHCMHVFSSWKKIAAEERLELRTRTLLL